MTDAIDFAPLGADIYCRISRDREGESLGVDRQQRDCEAMAERLGWEVVAFYVTTTSQRTRANPIRSTAGRSTRCARGKSGGVLTWHPDRLYRRAVDLEEIVNIAGAQQLQIATVASGDVDLSTPTGRTNARIIGAVAQWEVERTRQRVVASKKQAAAQGRYRGGPRP
jgi:DNA invertase Pin-like site-specific DNA recombinase